MIREIVGRKLFAMIRRCVRLVVALTLSEMIPKHRACSDSQKRSIDSMLTSENVECYVNGFARLKAAQGHFHSARNLIFLTRCRFCYFDLS